LAQICEGCGDKRTDLQQANAKLNVRAATGAKSHFAEQGKLLCL
jgi:hypothetical protein